MIKKYFKWAGLGLISLGAIFYGASMSPEGPGDFDPNLVHEIPNDGNKSTFSVGDPLIE